MADAIVLCFDPNTLSPISMIEFGLHARNGKLIVYCPDGFWKKWNIDITSEFYNIKQVDSFESLKTEIKNIINSK